MGCFIIAEAGVNHNGDMELAKKLIDVAVEAKCDAVKFQTFVTELGVTKSARKAIYQVENTGQEGTQFEMVKKLELDYDNHVELVNYCKDKGIIFLSTPFDLPSVDLLEEMDVPIYKIPSGEITNPFLIKHIARKHKPIILSTGMATLGEIEKALEWIYKEGNNKVALLHCTSSYPTMPEEVNLRAIQTMKDAFKVDIGYSDHTLGIEVPIAAVALGASIIEKHITLDNTMEGPDHKASLEPHQLFQMVSAIRNIEKAMGDGIKRPMSSETDTRIIARKSIVAVRNIGINEIITEEMLTVKRPGTGIQPTDMDLIIGRKVKNNILADTIINYNDLY